MCRAISGIAILADGVVRVYTSRRTDSHTAIREEHHIRDDGGPGASRQTPVELVPVGGVDRLADMIFAFGDDRPDWWTDEHTDQAKAQLFAAWRERWTGTALAFAGDLDLGALTSLPAGVKLSAGNDLDLGALTSLPAGVKLSAGNDLYLSSLTSLPAGVKLSAGNNLDLSSLTSLPAGVKLSAGGYLNLGALTSLPAGAKLSAGGYLDLGALTSLPAGATRESIRARARARWQREKK